VTCVGVRWGGKGAVQVHGKDRAAVSGRGAGCGYGGDYSLDQATGRGRLKVAKGACLTENHGVCEVGGGGGCPQSNGW